ASKNIDALIHLSTFAARAETPARAGKLAEGGGSRSTSVAVPSRELSGSPGAWESVGASDPDAMTALVEFDGASRGPTDGNVEIWSARRKLKTLIAAPKPIATAATRIIKSRTVK